MDDIDIVLIRLLLVQLDVRFWLEQMEWIYSHV